MLIVRKMPPLRTPMEVRRFTANLAGLLDTRRPAPGPAYRWRWMMLEILQFYVSGFWVWLGITIGLVYVTVAAGGIAEAIVKALRK